MAQRVQIDAVCSNETKTIDAYQTQTPGLVVHRRLTYMPRQGTHRFDSRWQITHEGTGHAVLYPSECPGTMIAAMAIAKDLGEIDWSPERQRSPQELERIAEKVRKVVAAQPKPVEEKSTQPNRYVVRRNQETTGYAVIDSDNDQVVEEFVHRGLASQKAKELNQESSI